MIAKNISLQEIDTNKTMLEDFKKCNYLEEIWEIEQFLEGFFEQINDLYSFNLYLKYIFNIDEIQDNDININIDKYQKIAIKTNNKFYNLLNNTNKKDLNKEIISQILRKIILIYFIFIYNESIKNGDELFKKIVENSISIYQEKKILEIIITNVINNQSIKIKIGDIKFQSMIDSIINVLYKKISIIKDKILCFKMIEESEAYNKIIELFPKHLEIDYFFAENESEILEYLYNFFNLLNQKEFKNMPYFKVLIEKCKLISKDLEEKKINYSYLEKLKYLINNKKLYRRTYILCLGDETESNKLKEIIENYVTNYIEYYNNLETLIAFYNKYFSNYKNEEINNYYKQEQELKGGKTNICDIKINENIKEEIKKFEKYEKSQFFKLFYKKNM